MQTSTRIRKGLTIMLAIVVIAALLAVYFLWGRSRDEPPNEPPVASEE